MLERSIEDWCENFNIKYYDITEEGLINVNGGVGISWKELTVIPIKFGVVTGDFGCITNGLISLEGSPIKVGGGFHCGFNDLTSLEGCPSMVGGYYDCSDNELTSLEGAPKSVGGFFNCRANKLISLYGGPNKIGGWFNCDENPVYEEYSKYDNYTQYMRSFKIKELLCRNNQ
jgi:hypothetical protein